MIGANRIIEEIDLAEDRLWFISLFNRYSVELNANVNDVIEEYSSLENRNTHIKVIRPKAFCYYSYLKDGTIWLKGIAVEKEYRGLGIGRELLEYLKDEGVGIITATYQDRQVQNFYKRNGFYENGEVVDSVGNKMTVFVKE